MIAAVAIEAALLALFLLTALCVVAHTLEEMGAAGRSFWAYYGDHFGPRAPWYVGLPLFVGLGGGVIAVAYMGLVHGGGSAWWLAALVGLLSADFLLSHAGLRYRFPGYNPGFASSFLYVALVALILVAAGEAVRREPAGFAAGFAVFGLFWHVSFLVVQRAFRGRA